MMSTFKSSFRVQFCNCCVCSAIKFYATMKVTLTRESEAGTQSTDAGFRTEPQTLCFKDDQVDYDAMYRDLNAQLDRFCSQGSGWNLQQITEFVLHTSVYRPLIGSSYIQTPKFIADKRCVVNVKNSDDNKCFKWAILSALYPVEKNAWLVNKYKKYEDQLCWDGLDFPTQLNQIRLFEKNNTSLTVNVYIHKPEEDDGIIPMYLTKHQAREKHVDLLLITEGEKSHFTWICNMSRLVAHRSSRKGETFVCPHALHTPLHNENCIQKAFPGLL